MWLTTLAEGQEPKRTSLASATKVKHRLK